MDKEKCWYKGNCRVKCTDACIRFNCMHSLFNLSQIPEYLWLPKKLECSRTDEQAFKQLQAIEDNIDLFVDAGRNVYIYSENCGNGKTSWSVRLMRAYFDTIWHKSGFSCHGLFISVPKFLYDCKRSISQDVEGFKELCKLIESCELVIWDDLPTSEFTNYEHQIVFQYIDGRINAGKANIFTGNCGKAECYRILGDRLASRIYGSSEVVEFKERDKRGAYNGRIADFEQDTIRKIGQYFDIK